MLPLFFFSAVKLQLLRSFCRETPYEIDRFERVYHYMNSLNVVTNPNPNYYYMLELLEKDTCENAKYMNDEILNCCSEYLKVLKNHVCQRSASFDNMKKAFRKFINEFREMLTHQVLTDCRDCALQCLKEIYRLSYDTMKRTANTISEFDDSYLNKLSYWRKNGNTCEQIAENIRLLTENERKQIDKIKEDEKNLSQKVTELTDQLRGCLGRKENLFERMFYSH